MSGNLFDTLQLSLWSASWGAPIIGLQVISNSRHWQSSTAYRKWYGGIPEMYVLRLNPFLVHSH